MSKRFWYIVLLVGILVTQLQAQENKLVLKDTLDGKLDLSNYVINMHGFIPTPFIITEPAVGSFGAGLALTFISPMKNFRFPDITGVAGMYTANKSWAGALFRQGTLPKWELRYTTALAYGDINMSFYRNLENKGQQEYEFKLKPFFLLLDVNRNLYQNRIFAGLRYMFTNMQVNYAPGDALLPDSIFSKAESDQNLGTLGLYGEYDSRNSMFTPDKGIRFKGTYTLARSFLGSDIDIERLDGFLHIFVNPRQWLVSGFRIEGQMISDGAPFYYLPFLLMRGLPIMKYQGEETILFETEQRFDLNLRWSLVGFIGTGRTYNDSKYLQDDNWYTAGGAGFRYLVARLFKLRMGVDVALGPDNQFAYYIIFGHNWMR